MAYIVEQKIKGNIYLYEVKSYWDKKKKQPRQKRKYLGPKNRKQYSNIKSNLISKNYGDIFLTKYISEKLGLKKILKNCFKDCFEEMLLLVFYTLLESTPSYLFPYWYDLHYIQDRCKMHSKEISALYQKIGFLEKERMDFIKKWIKHINPKSGIYYDITSISSYCKNIPEVEWGYNRDDENLPQINLGMIYCNSNFLPISYNIFPGSIVDVSTLKNTIKLFKIFNEKKLFFILDKGFCSKANIMDMNNNDISFMQPLSLSLQITKDIIKKHRRSMLRLGNIFKYKQEILYHKSSKLKWDKYNFTAHIFYNEKTAVEQKHSLCDELLKIKKKNNRKFNSEEEFEKYKNDNIHISYKKYFKLNKKTMEMVKNENTIKEKVSFMGIFVILANNFLEKKEVLELYRNKDQIEKVFDLMKNDIDGKRIRSHNEHTAKGNMFIKFLSLIIRSEMLNVIKSHKSLKKYSIREIIAELKKLKINTYKKDQYFFSKLSKKQKEIFKAFKINFDKMHSY